MLAYLDLIGLQSKSKPYIEKIMRLSCCACCCFYPKYKRKVDNIYPRNVDAPLVKNEVDKLQYYVTVHPEKLSKIGDCLYHNLKRGLNGAHRNRNYVINTIEAVEKILIVITPQNLNYFATNYFKIIQKLLEQSGSSSLVTSLSTNSYSTGTNPNGTSSGVNGSSSVQNLNNADGLEYQKMAASLFQKFCEKESTNLSSTVNYNVNFDQFVCQFSTMCYNANKDERVRAEVRSSGLQCLATMVKRLVPDDNLRAGYIWDNMDKIIPALLFIMHEYFLVNNKKMSNLNENEESVNHDTDTIENDLNRYLYGDLYINNKINASNGNSGGVNGDGGEMVKLDSVRIQFTKSNTQMNPTSGASTPDESNVMINLNDQQHSAIPQVIDPDHEAKLLLKNIASKADYTTISKIVAPILTFLDDNKPKGWEMGQFVRCIFLIVMYNVKQQHAIVIKELIKHIDSHRNSSALLKCHILHTINVCIGIAAMQSVGTAGQIIEIFTNLLKHLNFSVEKAFNLKLQLINRNPAPGPAPAGQNSAKINSELYEEQKLQHEIIKSMGQFTLNLPDYVKNEVFMFIARQINSQQFSYNDLANLNPSNEQINSKEQLNSQIRARYFECLHEICTKYKPSQLFSAFTSFQFLEDILRLTLVNDWSSRRKAHEILHQLLDKYQILDKIKQIKPSLFTSSDFSSSSSSNQIIYKEDSRSSLNRLTKEQPKNNRSSITSVNLKTNKPAGVTSLQHPSRNQTYLSQLELDDLSASTSRDDIQFMRKHGRAFLAHINENIFLANNRRENYESIYLTMCLFLVGLFNEKEFLIDLIRFGFYLQELALLNHDQPNFSFSLQCNVHKFICAYFLLLSKSSGMSEFYKYCSAMCDLRKRRDLFKFVFPEYILLDQMASSDSGIQSMNTSLTEIETEFKRDLSASAKEYTSSVKRESKRTNSTETLDAKNEDEDRDDNKRKSTIAISLPTNKMASWLFDKFIVDEILKQAGYATNGLFVRNNEFSLSVNYLQQNVASIQTVLRYRSPYSCSYESLSVLNDPNDLNSNNLGLNSAYNKGHTRGLSGIGVSPSTNQFNTPRKSLDVESNMDDDTSYDSTSQISMDPNFDFDLVNQPNLKLFYIETNHAENGNNPNGNSVTAGNNQTTISSLNAFKQQQLLLQQDITSFETIKRVLFNGTGIGSGGSNIISSNNSAAGGVAGSSTIGIGSTTGANTSHTLTNTRASATNFKTDKQQQDIEETDSQLDSSLKIISDFKQKPFDELKQNLMKTNQSYVNTEKYKQVFDTIYKEIQQQQQQHQQHSPASLADQFSNNIGTCSGANMQTGSYTSINNNNNNNPSGNIKNTSISSMSSNLSASTGSNTNILTKDANYTTSKTIPLNDIEFPQLFMF